MGQCSLVATTLQMECSKTWLRRLARAVDSTAFAFLSTVVILANAVPRLRSRQAKFSNKEAHMTLQPAPPEYIIRMCLHMHSGSHKVTEQQRNQEL